jgi:microcystin-dependent protein
VTLGSATPIDKDNFTGVTFIGIQVGTDPELALRQQLTSVAYAFKAEGAIPAGTILEYAGSSAPSGYLLCQGGAVSRTTYSALFAIIGTTYGVGDGSTTFNLPDKRNRTSFGAGGTYALGDNIGSATVDLSHTHTGPNHRHTGPSHQHTGVDHLHSVSITSGNNNDTDKGENGDNDDFAGRIHGHSVVGNTGAADRSLTTGWNGTGFTSYNGTGATGAMSANATPSVINPGLVTNFIVKY